MRFRNCIASVSLFVPTMLVLALGGLILPTAYGAQSPGSNQASHLYFFTNDGCAPCRQVEPSIEALHREGYPVTTIKISEQPEVADRFHVDRTPTVVLVTGNQITGRHAGQISLPTLREWFAAVGQRPVAIAKTKPRVQTRPQPLARAATPEAGTKVVIGSDNQPAGSKNALARATDRSAKFSTPTMLRGTDRPGDGYEARALAATVRLKVEDPEGISYATGTVIHARENEALVMTCGHVFRDAVGKGVITAEYGFADGQVHTAPGTLIQYDADAKDIGLVAIQTKHQLTVAPVAMASARVERGDTAFSIGCDHGQRPTIRRSAIKNRAKYDGEIKYDIYGRPVDGRSGGGLFTDRGELIGICNAAAVEVDEGIYSALDTIHWQLAATKLDHLFNDKTQPALASNDRTQPVDRLAARDPSRNEFAQSLSGQRTAATARARTRIRPRQPLAIDHPNSPPRQTRVGLDVPRGIGAGTDMEVIILVRSKSDPTVSDTITVQDPSPELLAYLNQMQASNQEARRLDVARLRQRVK